MTLERGPELEHVLLKHPANRVPDLAQEDMSGSTPSNPAPLPSFVPRWRPVTTHPVPIIPKLDMQKVGSHSVRTEVGGERWSGIYGVSVSGADTGGRTSRGGELDFPSRLQNSLINGGKARFHNLINPTPPALGQPRSSGCSPPVMQRCFATMTLH